MTNKAKQGFIELAYSALSHASFSKTSKPRKYFIACTLWLFACIRGKINFLQLERFSKFGEQYFRIGFQKKFNFLDFNAALVGELVEPYSRSTFPKNWLSPWIRVIFPKPENSLPEQVVFGQDAPEKQSGVLNFVDLP
jgi:hypothetical protein